MYAVWLVGFSLFKMLRFAEWEAAVFLIVGAAVLALAVSGPARRWAC